MQSEWYIDSGASHHMASSESWLQAGSKRKCKPVQIKTGSGAVPTGNTTCTVELRITLSEGWKSIRVDDVLVIPGIEANILSVSRIQSQGYKLVFSDNECIIHKLSSRTPVLQVRKAKEFTILLQELH